MLTLEKRTSLATKIQLALTVIILIFGIWTWGIVFHHFSPRTICLKIPISEYAGQNAPARCQELWREGKL